MKRIRPSQTPNDTSGFSLLELMVVLGIIAMVAAMATPQFMSMLRENAVFGAADDLREALGETRRYAIDTGIDYEFRYELNGSTAVVLPSENELNETDSGQSTTTEKYVRILIELSEDMRIRAAAGVEESSETLEALRFGDLPGTELTRKSWSTPVLFRFDGTADDFEFRVSDASGLTSKVTLRGLTGTGRTTQVYQEED